MAHDRALTDRVWAEPLRALLDPRRTRLAPNEQRALMSILTGTACVRDTLRTWGLSDTTGPCSMCQAEPDTLAHRMWKCQARGLPPPLEVPSWLAEAQQRAEPGSEPYAAERLWREPPRDRAERL